MTLAAVALGANLGQPIPTLRAAALAIARLPQTRRIAVSSVYQSAPQEVLDPQPDYFNAVMLIETTLEPLELLHAVQKIEDNAGRQRPHWHAARTLDLDILFYGDSVLNSPELTLPHPRMASRVFVIVPLAEIAPQVSIPGLGSVSALRAMFPTDALGRIGTL